MPTAKLVTDHTEIDCDLALGRLDNSVAHIPGGAIRVHIDQFGDELAGGDVAGDGECEPSRTDRPDQIGRASCRERV